MMKSKNATRGKARLHPLVRTFTVTEEMLSRMDLVADRLRDAHDPEHEFAGLDLFIRQCLCAGVACCAETISMPKHTPERFGRFSEHRANASAEARRSRSLGPDVGGKVDR